MEFLEVDEALYRHEAPYYRSAATGGFFEATPEWKDERARLTELWLHLCPYPTLKTRTRSSLIRRFLIKIGFGHG